MRTKARPEWVNMPKSKTYSAKVKGRLALSLMCAIWGSTFVLNKSALTYVGVFAFLSLRFSLAASILLVGVARYKRERFRLVLKTKRVYLVGFVLFLGYCLQTLGLRLISPSNSGFITGLSVAIVPIAAMSIGSRVRPLHVLAVLVGIVGLYFLSAPLSASNIVGELLTLACSVAFALQIVYTESLDPTLDPISVVAIEVAIVAFLSFAITLSPFDTKPLSTSFDVSHLLNPTVLSAVVIGGALATALALVTQTYFQRYLSSTEVAIIYNLEPLFAAVFAVLVDHLPLSMFEVIGGVFVLSAMTLSALVKQEYAGT